MTTAALLPNWADISPRRMARLTGGLFLLTIVLGIIAEAGISQRLVVWGDAAATAGNIRTHASLYRLGFTLYLVEMMAQVAMTVLFYHLLRPVSRPAALVAAVLGLVGCTIKTLSRLFYLAPLIVLEGDAEYLRAFDLEQLQSLALLLLRVNDQTAAIALAFFGLQGLIEGYLIFRSTFLPRFLGILSFVGGLGWLTYVSPALGLRLFPVVAGVGILGALVNIGWLLIVGVDEERWKAQVSLAAGSHWR